MHDIDIFSSMLHTIELKIDFNSLTSLLNDLYIFLTKVEEILLLCYQLSIIFVTIELIVIKFKRFLLYDNVKIFKLTAYLN